MYANLTGKFKTKQLNPRLLVILKIFAVGYTIEHTHSWPKYYSFDLADTHTFIGIQLVIHSRILFSLTLTINRQQVCLSINICCTNHSISPSSRVFVQL